MNKRKMDIIVVIERTKKKHAHMNRIIFGIEDQNAIENVMANLGYGCGQYWLSFIPKRHRGWKYRLNLTHH